MEFSWYLINSISSDVMRGKPAYSESHSTGYAASTKSQYAFLSSAHMFQGAANVTFGASSRVSSPHTDMLKRSLSSLLDPHSVTHCYTSLVVVTNKKGFNELSRFLRKKKKKRCAKDTSTTKTFKNNNKLFCLFLKRRTSMNWLHLEMP